MADRMYSLDRVFSWFAGDLQGTQLDPIFGPYGYHGVPGSARFLGVGQKDRFKSARQPSDFAGGSPQCSRWDGLGFAFQVHGQEFNSSTFHCVCGDLHLRPDRFMRMGVSALDPICLAKEAGWMAGSFT